MGDNFMSVVYAMLIGFVMLVLVNTVLQSQECDRKGGVLMRPQIGTYVCVKPIK